MNKEMGGRTGVRPLLTQSIFNKDNCKNVWGHAMVGSFVYNALLPVSAPWYNHLHLSKCSLLILKNPEAGYRSLEDKSLQRPTVQD